MGNIVVGLLFIVGGASGKIALRGTNSSGALVVVGLVLIGFGIFRLVSNANANRVDPE